MVNDELEDSVDNVDLIIRSERAKNVEAVLDKQIANNIDFINNMRKELTGFSKGE